MREPMTTEEYAITDYTIRIKEAGGIGYVPQSGVLKALQDTIVQDKGYIDNLADIAATLLTTFNDVHKQGAGIDADATTWLNFFGDNGNKSTATGGSYTGTHYTWHVDAATGERWMEQTAASVNKTVSGTTTTITMTDSVVASDKKKLKSMQIINALKVASELTAPGGQNLVAARQIYDPTVDPLTSKPKGMVKPTISAGSSTYTYDNSWINGTGDGTMAVELSKLFNTDQGSSMNPAGTERPVSTISINQYYNGIMSKLGANAETVDKKLKQQDDLITQITQWRQSTAGVNWNEELTNMLKFQTGYGACSRVLTSMDEMLDKLINSTGTVGR